MKGCNGNDAVSVYGTHSSHCFVHPWSNSNVKQGSESAVFGGTAPITVSAFIEAIHLEGDVDVCKVRPLRLECLPRPLAVFHRARCHPPPAT